MSQKNTVSIYCCGGAGINIGTRVLSIPSSVVAFPNTEITLVDTSSSNLAGVNKEMNTYLIPGLDGAGKERRFAHEQMKPHINPILTKYQPKDFNIVIFSLSGGSGSVAGPLLVDELLRRNQDVVAFCIGNAENGKEAENSIATISTLQNLSRAQNKPIVARFYMNDNDTTLGRVDNMIENDVRALCMLVSGNNHGMDTKDIHNFLHYHNVTKVPPQLVDLMLYSPSPDAPAPTGFTAIAVASVLPTRDDHLIQLGQLYGCVGYMPAGVAESTSETFRPLHFILSNAHMNDRLEQYANAQKKFKESEAALVNTNVKQLAEGGEDGFVF